MSSLAERVGNLEAGGWAANVRETIGADRRERPRFSASWVSPRPPASARLVRSYEIEGSEVRLYRVPGGTESVYFMVPWEYALPAEHIRLVHLARERLRATSPASMRALRPDEVRAYIMDRGERLIPRLAADRRIPLGADRADEVRTARQLAASLAAYTVGLGVLEIPLRDPNVQDVYVDAPAGRTPVYVTIADVGPDLYQRCVTNVHLTSMDAEALVARLRLASGRPFSEATPVLETNLEEFRVRATAVGPPLSPDGLAVALRRHATDPWTLPRLIATRALSPFAAGLLSFLIDGRATVLIAGARGAGKTSLLGALLFEFPLSQRIVTIEDTRELPTADLQALGHKVQSLFVRSALGGHELSAEEALRASLRLGESALVLGEVRGQEARTLYEAMRAGTAGSSVLGTIHGNSARAAYERIVHDLGIPPASFAATDVVVVAGLVRPGGVQRTLRRVVEVTDVAKSRGPDAFEPLLVYDAATAALQEAPGLAVSETIRTISDAWALTYEQAMENILVRATIRATLAERSRNGDPEFASPAWVSRANAAYWGLVEDGRRGVDLLDAWRLWFQETSDG